MKSIQQIEDWIETIESSSIPVEKQEKQIADVVNFWKFVTNYNNDLSILEQGKVLINENGFDEVISITTADFNLSKKRNPFEVIIAEIETELLKFGSKYLGLYTIRFHNLKRNFQEEDLNLVKEEILSAIKGDLIYFKYIYKIHKIEANELKIFKNDLGVLQCDAVDIQKQISKIKYKEDATSNWLVLILDGMDHNCDFFLFENKIKERAFESKFEKVFVFDFYKSEMIQLQLNVKIAETTATAISV